MEKSVLLGTKPLVDSIRHFIRDPSGVFSVSPLWVSYRSMTSRFPPFAFVELVSIFSLHIIKITLHVGSKIWILCSRGKNKKFISSRHRVISSIYGRVFVFNIFLIIISDTDSHGVTKILVLNIKRHSAITCPSELLEPGVLNTFCATRV